MKVALPVTVKVGPFRYKIITDAQDLRDYEHNHGSHYVGYTSHKDLKIVIDATQAESQQAETLWHEIKHAVLHVIKFDKKDPSLEDYVYGTTPMELAVLRDNPGVVMFLVEAGMNYADNMVYYE
jgi:hypothetical protein